MDLSGLAWFQSSTDFWSTGWLPPVSPHMVAESLLTFEPAGPDEPQAARLTASPAAEIANAAERNFRIFISLPFILRAQRWVPVTCEAGVCPGSEADGPRQFGQWSYRATFESFRNFASGGANLAVSRVTVKG